MCSLFDAGEVNILFSSVVMFHQKVPKLSKNEILVNLLDSFSNPVLSQESKLQLEITSVNSSEFSTWDVVDYKDGSYGCSYMAKDVGTYEICVIYENKQFTKCPYIVNVYSSKYK